MTREQAITYYRLRSSFELDTPCTKCKHWSSAIHKDPCRSCHISLGGRWDNFDFAPWYAEMVHRT